MWLPSLCNCWVKCWFVSLEDRSPTAGLLKQEVYRGPDGHATHTTTGVPTVPEVICQRVCAYVLYFYGMHRAPMWSPQPRTWLRSFNQGRANVWKDWEIIQNRRGTANNYLLTGGPEQSILQALDIDKSWNKVQFPKSPLRIYEDGFNPGLLFETLQSRHVCTCGRHSYWPWQFHLKNNPWVSRLLNVSIVVRRPF